MNAANVLETVFSQSPLELVPDNRITALLRPLQPLLAPTGLLQFRSLGLRSGASSSCELPCFQFLGPHGGGDPVRIGIFAAIHGDEPAGAHAAVRFLESLVHNPETARGYQLFVYPVCNPTGFLNQSRLSASGKDLNREFWSQSAEEEVTLLEHEIRAQHFHGLISLHADDTSDGVYGFVRGAVLTRHLLEPALAAASRILPRNNHSVIDGFPAEDGIISQCYDGILTSPPDLDPVPFEIILETPYHAPQSRQEEAFLAAMAAILAEYQKFLAFAADL